MRLVRVDSARHGNGAVECAPCVRVHRLLFLLGVVARQAGSAQAWRGGYDAQVGEGGEEATDAELEEELCEARHQRRAAG